MAVGRANYNGTATAGNTKVLAGQNASRQKFFFRSIGDTFILNFGAAATATDVLKILPNETVSMDNTDPYDIRAQINIFCANASAYEAQAEEMAVNP